MAPQMKGKVGEETSDVSQGWNSNLEELFSSIDDKDIDWVHESNLILSALPKDDRPDTFLLRGKIWGTSILDASNLKISRIMRKIAWRLFCMKFVHIGKVRYDEINSWLQSASRISSDGFRKKVEDFLERNFGVVIE